MATTDDFVLVQPSNSAILSAGLGNDTYLISPSIVGAGQVVTISDASGSNKIELVGGLSITSSKATATILQLTLSNGAIINLSSAQNFSFAVGANSVAGIAGTVQTYEQLLTTTLGYAAVPVGETVVPVTTPVVIGGGSPTPTPGTYTVSASPVGSVAEGGTITYTITASTAPTTDKVLTYSIVGDTISGAAVAADGSDYTPSSGNVTILAGQTTATVTISLANDGAVEGAEGIKFNLLDATTLQSVATPVTNIIIDGPDVGKTYTLTPGVDDIPGTVANDTVNGILNDAVGATNATFTPLDKINGAGGVNTMNISDLLATGSAMPSVTVQNIQTLNWEGSGAVTVDTSTGFTGLATLNVIKGVNTAATAATTTDIAVSGITGTIAVDGGKNITVTDATVDKAIAIGGTTVAAGTITVTDSKQGTGAIDVDGGTDATITATTAADLAAVNGGTIKVGLDGGTPVAPTGAVKITQNLNSTGGDADVDDLAGGAISVKGGKTVDITVNATSTATKAGADGDITIGTVTITGDSKTTDVTVTQNSSVTTFTTPTVAAVADQTVVTFKAMTAGQTSIVNGLTFTASKALTADQAAAAFASLGTADTQDKGGPTVNGTYSGTSNTVAFVSGAASGAAVTFTAASTVGDVLALGGTVVPTQTSFTAGSAASGGVATTNTVTLGSVVVDDHATEAIKNITLNGFVDGTLGGGGGSLDALTTLNLTNSAGDTALTSTSKTLAVTLNKVAAGDLDLSTNGAVETLTLTTTGTASNIDLVAKDVKSLTIDAGVALTLQTGGNYDDLLETVVVKGAGAVNLGNISAASAGNAIIKSFDASANEGGVTATISAKTADVAATFTEYLFSKGADVVTVSDATVNKNISLGAGDDKITLAAITTTLAATIDGGTGSNTLVMDSADAAAAAGATTFEAKITGFDKLGLNIVATTAQDTVNLDNMDDIKYVISAGTTDTKQKSTITFGGTEAAGGDDVLTTTITDAGGTSTFTTTVAAGTAATDAGTVVSAVTKVSSTGTYTLVEDAGVVTITSNTDGLPFTASTVLTTGTAGEITWGALTAKSSQLTLDKMLDGGTLELTAAGTGAVVTMKDASGTADTFNIVTKVAGAALNFGTVNVAGVETVNITATDTVTTTIEKSTLYLAADTATTVNVLGNGHVDLTLSGSDAVTLVDGSTGFTGGLTFTSKLNDLVVKGGSGADSLTAAANDVKLYGNGGADTLTVTSGLRVNLYGGDGADTFDIKSTASLTLDAYTVINGVDSGDVIKLQGATKFSSTKVTLSLGADETLLNYANQAVKVLAVNEMGWFQRGGNTYIVEDLSGTDAFVAGTDMIIMLTGVVELGTGASYNSTSNILEII